MTNLLKRGKQWKRRANLNRRTVLEPNKDAKSSERERAFFT